MSDRDYEAILEQAMAAGVDRNYHKAAELLLRIVSETDRLPQAYLYLGRSYHALGRYDVAVQFLEYFLNLRTDVGAGHYFLGRSYFALGMVGDAIINLKRAVRMEPRNAQPKALLALAYLKVKRSDLALENLSEAVELDPDNKVVYEGYLNTLLVEAIRQFRKGNLDLSRQMLSFLVEKGRAGVVPHLYLATIYKITGAFEDALHHYERAMAFAPNDPVILLQRADVLDRIGRRDQAILEIQRSGFAEPEELSEWSSEDICRRLAIESYENSHYRKAVNYAKRVIKQIGPDHEMHLLLGESFRTLGSLEKAANHFVRAIELRRYHVESRYGLVMTLWQMGKWEQLLGELGKLERIDPGNAIGSYYMALCMCKLARPTAKTVPLLRREIESNTDDVYLLTALGEQLLRDSQLEEAEAWFRRAIDNSKDHRPAYHGLIEACKGQGSLEKKLDTYDSYLSHFQDDHEVRLDYIRLLVDSNIYDDAAKQIQQYLPLDPENAELNRLLAYCYRKTARYREAAFTYRKLLRAEPESEEYLRALCFCLEKAGNRATSITLMEKALAYLQPTVTLLLIYGVLLYKEGRYDKALEVFRDVLNSAPTEWRAYSNMAMIYRKRGLDDFAERFFAQAEQYRAKA